MTSTERFRIALIEYGTQLANNGEVCEALEYFQRALEIAPDPEVQPTVQWVFEECERESQPEPQEPQYTPTPSPTGTAPTEVPTQQTPVPPTTEPTQEPTGQTP